MYVLALSDYKQHAAAAGYKPAPQLGRQIAVYPHDSLQSHNKSQLSYQSILLAGQTHQIELSVNSLSK